MNSRLLLSAGASAHSKAMRPGMMVKGPLLLSTSQVISFWIKYRRRHINKNVRLDKSPIIKIKAPNTVDPLLNSIIFP
jgi:hypothetical protein